MACNCGSQKSLKDVLMKHQEYREMGKSFKEKLIKLGVKITMLFITPLIIGFLLYKGFISKNKKISIAKLYGLRAYAK